MNQYNIVNELLIDGRTVTLYQHKYTMDYAVRPIGGAMECVELAAVVSDEIGAPVDAYLNGRTVTLQPGSSSNRMLKEFAASELYKKLFS